MNGTPEQMARPARFGWWIVAGMLLAVNGAVLLAGPDSMLRQQPALDILSYLVPMGIAGLLAGILSTRARTPIERSFWATFALSFTALFFAECYWTWYVLAVDADGPPLSNPVTALYALALALFLSLVVRLTKPATYSPWRYIRLLTDVVVGAWACIPIVYWVWTYPLIGDVDGGGPLAAAVAAIYPVMGVFIAGATLTTLWSLTRRRWRGWHWAVASALWLFSATMVLYPVWRLETLSTAGAPSSWYASLLGFALLILVGAQISRLTRDEGEADSQQEVFAPATAPRWVAVGYPVAVSCGLVWLGWTALVHGRDPEGPALVFFAWTLAILLAARSCLAAVEVAAYHRNAHTDALTGALVRSDFESTLAESVLVAIDARVSLALVVVDIAPAPRSDGVLLPSGSVPELRGTLAAITRDIRATHGPFMLGSSRFAYIMEQTSAERAREAALRTWRGLRDGGGPSAARTHIAFGIAAIPASSSDADSLVSAAHAAADLAPASEDEPIAMYDDRNASLPSGDVEHRTRMRAFREAVRGLAQAVDARDPYTKDHSTNVSDLAAALAQVLGMTDSDTQVIALASLVHDVGKVGVSDDVLLAGDDISDAGRASLRAHPTLGEAILLPARVEAILPIVRHHHERWDGSGYPDGLSGASIPQGARILAVCDSFESMTAPRSWRHAMTVEAALNRIEGAAGTRFDPTIARAFVRMVKALGTHGGTQSAVFGRAEV